MDQGHAGKVDGYRYYAQPGRPPLLHLGKSAFENKQIQFADATAFFQRADELPGEDDDPVFFDPTHQSLHTD